MDEVNNFHEGTQFHTRVGLGDQETQMMLDGGSAVNSVTEEQVASVLNHYRAKNIPLNDKRHPVLQLEKWPEEESVRGVAGGVTVKLVGSVVSGATDWVGMIVGAHAIDHQSRGGLGHQSAANGHWMQTLNIMMDRIDQCAGRVHRKDGIYSCEEASSAVFGKQLGSGSCDSDDDIIPSSAAGLCMGRSDRVLDRAPSEPASSLVYDGPPITVMSEDRAWLPVVLTNPDLSHSSSHFVALPVDGPVEIATGLVDVSQEKSFVFAANLDIQSEELQPGEVLAQVKPAVIQERHCAVCGNIDTDAWALEDSVQCGECGFCLLYTSDAADE